MPDEFLTVRNMIDRGELPAIRVGARRVRIERSDLDAFLAQGRRLTQRTEARVAFDDAVGTANRAIRGSDRSKAVEALRSLKKATLALADELEAGR